MLVLDALTEELDQRMLGPQRHRLLHGYPLAAAMWPRRAGLPEPVANHSPRPLVVGVLPHPFCNPAVAGCGFCTFPHQKYDAAKAGEVVTAVCREIKERVQYRSELIGRPVTALYFGGGTANLSPAEPFRALCRTLASAFDLSQAEVTLEGVPVYFLKRQPLLMDILREEIQARHFRISMGIQTFNEEELGRMGRLAFGTEATFAAVTDQAHSRGFTASADLLFNLPHETLAQMQEDVRKAVALGLDHVGLYHLVLFQGLGTVWSRQKERLAGLPDNETAAANWIALREQLLDAGFYQTTLTNFEREAFRGQPRRFVYEECGFQPHRFDMIGFGPSAITFEADQDFQRGLKLLNPDAATEYLARVEAGGRVWNRYFEYSPLDLRIFFLTRRLATLEIDRQEYRRLLKNDPLEHFPSEFRLLVDRELVWVRPQTISPTPRGMFYADSIASLWARRGRTATTMVAALNHNGHGHM